MKIDINKSFEIRPSVYSVVDGDIGVITGSRVTQGKKTIIDVKIPGELGCDIASDCMQALLERVKKS